METGKATTAEEDKEAIGIGKAAGDIGTSGKEEATVEDAIGKRASVKGMEEEDRKTTATIRKEMSARRVLGRWRNVGG